MRKKHFVSEEWELGKQGHGHFDFVDVDLDHDNELFIDPCRIEQSSHPLAARCQAVMDSFFDEFFKAYRHDDSDLKNYLLSHATEQNSTRLGYGHPGKGNTAEGLLNLFRPLERLVYSIETISAVQDLPVFVPGFDKDGLSDLLTNILHGELNQYTLDQMTLHQKQPNGLTQFYDWDSTLREWRLNKKVPCYLYENKPIMLVPKEFARKRYLFSTGQYLSRIIIERIREDGGGNDPKGKPVPKKQYVKYHIPRNSKHWVYENAVKYSQDHPDALTEYHKKLPEFYSVKGEAMDDADLDAYIYG